MKKHLLVLLASLFLLIPSIALGAGETAAGDELLLSPVGYKASGFTLATLSKSHEATTTETETADVISMGSIPRGAIPIGGYLACDDLDSGTALVIDVGDADDANGYLTADTTCQAGGIANFDGAYLTDKSTKTTKTNIFVKATTAAGTAVAGTIRLVVYYLTP